MIPIPLVCLMYSTLDPAEYVEIARVVQVEAYRHSNDEYGVAANIMNRVASDDFPDSIQGVTKQPHQYDGLKRFPNKKIDPELVAKLSSPKGQLGVCNALNKLEGRKYFKGQALLYNRVPEEDPMFHPNGNFYHH
tara:strand:- start:293 stop:697 length:405 start_codon:yes stop_codon:yes gene_type:complete